MPVKKLKAFLEDEGVKYVSMLHSPAFTAQEIAAAAHVSGKQLAKTVMVQIDGALAMVVLPADDQVNFAQLQEVVGKQIELASESDFKDRFPECEVGAMPPFGNLYDMPVYVSNSLAQQEVILFNAGSHSEIIQLKFEDYERLVQPKLVSI